MESKMNCPICNNKIIEEYYSGPFGIEEEHIHCNKCGYTFDFVYGNYHELVGNKEFIYSYHDYDKYKKKVYKAEFEAKRRWKKHKKGVTIIGVM